MTRQSGTAVRDPEPGTSRGRVGRPRPFRIPPRLPLPRLPLPRRRRPRTALRFPWLPLGIVLVVLLVPALFAPWLTGHDPLRGDLADRLLPPAWEHGGDWGYPLGTDKQGRDVLTRIVYGARISLTVSLVAVLAGSLVGAVLGLVAGYFGGLLDQVISFLVDTFQSLPFMLLALVVVAAIGPHFTSVITIISATIWAVFARLVRGEALRVRETDFVARARVAGASAPRIILRHVLPNVTNALVVMATLQVGVVILQESALSFIGAGIPRPQPSWGVMVADGRELVVTAWWLSFFPGLAILLVVLSLNLLGDWLRDFLDPRLRHGVR